MSQLADIRAIFVQQLQAYQTTAIAWENMPLDPVPDSFLRFSFFQDSIGQAEFGTYGRNHRQGTVQVSVFEPLHTGMGVALDKASDIEKVFPRGFHALFGDNHARVMRTEVEHPIPDDRYYHIPVSVYWHSYTRPVRDIIQFSNSKGGLYLPLSPRWSDTINGERADTAGETIHVWQPYTGPDKATAPTDGAEPTLTQ